MSVYLNPSSSLGFNRPLTQLVKRTLTITNHNALPVAFKVKTTAPKLYCVRPNSGRVEPHESVEVSVMLQSLKEDPPAGAKCKDKFLIQSTLLTPEKEALSGTDIWSPPENASDDAKVHQQKLKVVYLPAEGQTLEEEDENQLNQLNNPIHVISPDNSQHYDDTVRQLPKVNGHSTNPFSDTVQPPAPPAVRSGTPPVQVAEQPQQPTFSLVPDSAIPPPPISVVIEPPEEPAPAIERSRSLSPTPRGDELLIKLEEAQAEIERLRTLLAAAAPPPELRRRTNSRLVVEEPVSPGSEVGTMIMDEHHQEGVPLTVVVIIALGVFITTYLFF